MLNYLITDNFNTRSTESLMISYPWHKQNWQQLITRYRNDNLPHAMLFTGIVGVGKLFCATNFAQFLLCQNNKEQDCACGVCTSCNLFTANNHPDFLLVQPEEQGRAIKVEQIRQIIAEVGNTTHQGGIRVVVINIADAMNIAAANALLKTLEEPLSNVLIILVTSCFSALPATVISRCQRMDFMPPPFADALSWCETRFDGVAANDKTTDICCSQTDFQGTMAKCDDYIQLALRITHNAPLAALALLQDGNLIWQQKMLTDLVTFLHSKENQVQALRFAEACANVDVGLLVQFLFSIASDLIKLQLVVDERFITNIKYTQALRDCCGCFFTEKLLYYQEYLLGIGKIIRANIVLNKQLLLENLWLRLFLCIKR